MPQGRRKDFSGKQKKVQMQQKRQRKDQERSQGGEHYVRTRETIRGKTVEGDEEEKPDQVLVPEASQDVFQHLLASAASSSRHQRFDLRFRTESKEEVAVLRRRARQPLVRPPRPPEELPPGHFFPEGLSFPQRPAKAADVTSKSSLEALEERHFSDFLSETVKHFPNVSHFELNLETWRQLWRVMESSDVLLLVVDVRYAPAMMPPELYKVVKRAGKGIVVVLNKVDLVPAPLVLGWRKALIAAYPDIQVALFTSFPAYNLRATGSVEYGEERLQHRRLRGRIGVVTAGAANVVRAVEAAARNSSFSEKADLSQWRHLVAKAEAERESSEKKTEDTSEETSDDLANAAGDVKGDFLSVGLIGQPNAGKSSLINSLLGKRVVSVSKTPGHTKHFQTIFVAGRSVRLCDCPGLVFPSTVPKPLQVLMGSYPISQVREPFSVVQYLAERLDLVSLLRLKHPDEDNTSGEWSAFDVAEAWAIKRGYISARSAGRPDANRGANHILRMCLEGKVTLSLKPPNFDESEFSQEELDEVKNLLGKAEVVDRDDGASEDDEEESDAESQDQEEESEEDEEETKPLAVGNKFGILAEDD